jgi:hypothetical protein
MSQNEEVYVCLYCELELHGEQAWDDHRRTMKHGAVRRAREIEARVQALHKPTSEQEANAPSD